MAIIQLKSDDIVLVRNMKTDVVLNCFTKVKMYIRFTNSHIQINATECWFQAKYKYDITTKKN